MPRYDVFLNHAGADKPAVESLARRLHDAGVALFFDKWDLVPGERWIQELGEALAQSDTLAVFVGPKSGGGAWRTREVELALARAATELLLVPRIEHCACGMWRPVRFSRSSMGTPTRLAP